MSDNVWGWRHAILKSTLPAPTRHLLLTIGCYMNDLGQGCYPSIETLTEVTGMSKRAVINHIQIAVQEGWLIKRSHGFRGRKWRRNEYEACYPESLNKISNTAGEGGASGAPPQTQGGASGAPPQTQGGASGAFEVVHEVHTILPVDTSSRVNAREKKLSTESKNINELTSEHSASWSPEDEPDMQELIESGLQPYLKAEGGWELGADWELPLRWGEWAEENLRMLPGNILRQEERFKAWYRGPNARRKIYSDWLAVWQHWMLKEA